MIHLKYLWALALAAVAWSAIYFAFTLTMDPYGVSPLTVTLKRINQFKPMRRDIDRLIKPYEVWRYQPHTVFLGTSRIHQSIDPAALDGTKFAPAYNASIPASSLGLNISHLRQYLDLNPRLRMVVVELFLYNFLGAEQERAPKSLTEYLLNTAGLFVSADVLWASLQTSWYNLTKYAPVYEIKPGGYLYYPPGHDTKGPFDGFAVGIWKHHETRAEGMKLHEPAFDSVREFFKIAREYNLDLVFVLTPNHAYEDYYLEVVNEWKTVEDWLRRVSAEGAVYSFSQPNEWVYEPVRTGMRYWNDPYHFSLEFGNAMQHALAGRSFPGAPDNFMVRITPGNVAAHVADRRAAIGEWARANPVFVTAFQEEKRRWESRQAAGSDPVASSLAALALLQQGLAQIYPSASITAYRDVSGELVAAKSAPAHLVKNGRMENPWGGRLVAQIFPANAWGHGVPAMYNYFFESVPKPDCSRLVEALGRDSGRKVFRINIEPSGKVHSRFPASGADGCGEGKNTVGFTQFAE